VWFDRIRHLVRACGLLGNAGSRSASEVQVSGSLIGRIAGSNPAEVMDIRFMCLFCVVWVAASATGRSFVQRSPTGYVCVI